MTTAVCGSQEGVLVENIYKALETKFHKSNTYYPKCCVPEDLRNLSFNGNIFILYFLSAGLPALFK